MLDALGFDARKQVRRRVGKQVASCRLQVTGYWLLVADMR